MELLQGVLKSVWFCLWQSNFKLFVFIHVGLPASLLQPLPFSFLVFVCVNVRFLLTEGSYLFIFD